MDSSRSSESTSSKIYKAISIITNNKIQKDNTEPNNLAKIKEEIQFYKKQTVDLKSELENLKQKLRLYEPN
jgi:archaellum component FlaC